MATGVIVNAGCGLLAAATEAVGIKWLALTFVAVSLLGFGIWVPAAWYSGLSFRCPRCGNLFAGWRRRYPTRCWHCDLLLNAPRNPDANWKPS